MNKVEELFKILNTIIIEAVDLRCPNCRDNLGKDVENPNPAYCSNCGEKNIKNPRGYREEDDESVCEYDKAELDDALLLEPVGVVDGEFKLKINGIEYGYKPSAAYGKDMNSLEKEFLYKMTYPGKALAWLKANTDLTSKPAGKVAVAPSTTSKVTHTATVKSSAGTGDYTVKQHNDGAWTCTCPHHMHRGVECKHIKQVQDQLAQTPDKIAASATGESLKDVMSKSLKPGEVWQDKNGLWWAKAIKSNSVKDFKDKSSANKFSQS